MSPLRSLAALLVASLATTAACKRAPEPARPTAPSDAPPSIPPATDTGAPARADGTALPADAAAGPRALTIRVVNASVTPLPIYTNPDINELIHTRKLWPRRNPDASVDGELVKFFPVGQMPSCSEDGGAGYGGLGQPERRSLAPGEALEFTWDGQVRREVLNPQRGVCAETTAPEPARYRFEFDQPYNPPQCSRPVIQWPLAADAPRVIEIRCLPHARRGEE
jgi:hypothetical protein